MKIHTIFFLMILGMLSPSLAQAKRDELPFTIVYSSVLKKITIVNMGKCPVYKLELYTLPPDSSFLQRLTKSASFEANLGTLKEYHTLNIPFSSLLNGDGKRLDNSYVIGQVRFSGSYCGDTKHFKRSVK